METIRTERLTKTFKTGFQLGPLSLRVAPGEILGIMGPNGAGKTTLLRLLWGFMRPDSGDVSVFGLRPHLNQMKVRRRVGYLSANPQFDPALSAKQFLRFAGNFYEGWDEARTNLLLDRFRVPAGLKIGKLSNGDRIKLGLISALGHRPSLLMLDEPASGLDPLVRLDILGFLGTFAREENASILLSSHISDDLDYAARSILMLNDGRVVEYARGLSLAAGEAWD